MRAGYRALLLAFGLLAFGGMAEAQAQFYLSGDAGGGRPVDNTGSLRGAPVRLSARTGYALGAALGYQAPSHFRFELEAAIMRGSLDKLTVGAASAPARGNLDIRTISSSVYYDIPTGTGFSPYVGGGVGYAVEYGLSAGIPGTTVGRAGTSGYMAWRLEAGVGYRLTDHVTVAPAYRYQHLSDAGGGLSDTQIHIFKLALRYGF